MKHVIALLFLASLTHAAPAREVVVYTSVDDVFARPIAERFTRETGIVVKLVPDTEETKSTGLLNRLIAEKDRPVADVFWSGDPARAAVLKKKGISAVYASPEAKGLPRLFQEPQGHWSGFSARARILLSNTKLLPVAPTSILALADPKLKGKGCIANPLFGTTSMHAAALFVALGEVKAKELFESMLANGVKVLSSNGEVRRRVSAGDCAFGLTDTDDAWEAVREGKPVAVTYPDKAGMGTLIVPNVVVLIARAPHEAHGKRFIDFLLSPAVEQALAEGDAAQMPVRQGVKVPANVTPIDKLKPMQVDYQAMADRLEELSAGYLKLWVERASARPTPKP
jgi:iron(III) transport system substrate-binding protein